MPWRPLRPADYLLSLVGGLLLGAGLAGAAILAAAIA
jgi:hypothetical protein